MSKKAFSLIELSIVILIIGILVSGVTQSSRLIRQFRLSSAQSLTDNSPVNSIPDLVAWYETTKETSTFNGTNYQLDDGSAVTILKDIKQTSSVKYDLAANAGSNPVYKEEGINKFILLPINS